MVTSADVFGIYTESVQQHLDDAFANKGHPDASPHFPLASPAPFTDSALAPSQPATQPPPAEPPVSQHQQPTVQNSEDAVRLASAAPQLQDPAAPETAAAPTAEHTAAELPEGPAHDAAAATAANGMATAIVPSGDDVVVEAVTSPVAPPSEASPAEKPTATGDCALCRLFLPIQLVMHPFMVPMHGRSRSWPFSGIGTRQT